jgi:hypothetical protein
MAVAFRDTSTDCVRNPRDRGAEQRRRLTFRISRAYAQALARASLYV